MTSDQVAATEAAWEFVPGATLPVWRVRAFNDAIDSGNPIHDDARARALGFRGGLVPGVTLYGYLSHPLVALLGRRYLQQGGMDVRFRRPVYAGERVTVHGQVVAAATGGANFALELRNEAGEPCVVATAAQATASPDPATFPPVAPLQAAKRPATPEALRANPLLGALHETLTAAQSAAFLRSLGEDLDVYREVVHPAWLLRQANYLVDRNLAVGPWIHVSSTISHLGTIAPDEPFTVSGRVRDVYVRNGADYVDLDVLVAGVRPAMHVVHRAIFRMPEATASRSD